MVTHRSTRATGRRPNTKRPTPHLTAWLAQLKRELEPAGVKSELARYLAGDAEPAVIRSWLNAFQKYFRRVSIPSGEFVLAVEAWRWGKTRRQGDKETRGEGAKPPPTRRT